MHPRLAPLDLIPGAHFINHCLMATITFCLFLASVFGISYAIDPYAKLSEAKTWFDGP